MSGKDKSDDRCQMSGKTIKQKQKKKAKKLSNVFGF